MPGKTASSDPPIIIKPPTQVGPPVIARVEELQMSLPEALAQEPAAAADLGQEEVAAEGQPVGPAIPTENEVTLVVTIAGNIVDLDLAQHKKALALSVKTGQPLLFRLVGS